MHSLIAIQSILQLVARLSNHISYYDHNRANFCKWQFLLCCKRHLFTHIIGTKSIFCSWLFCLLFIWNGNALACVILCTVRIYFIWTERDRDTKCRLYSIFNLQLDVICAKNHMKCERPKLTFNSVRTFRHFRNIRTSIKHTILLTHSMRTRVSWTQTIASNESQEKREKNTKQNTLLDTEQRNKIAQRRRWNRKRTDNYAHKHRSSCSQRWTIFCWFANRAVAQDWATASANIHLICNRRHARWLPSADQTDAYMHSDNMLCFFLRHTNNYYAAATLPM